MPAADLIIAGDWVVDEYWYLVRQHSEISSHTGFVHYRASSKPTERVLDLCSAGHVARVLYTLREKTQGSYTIWGIGDWNPDDTEHLEHLIHAGAVPECEAARANFSLGWRFCDNPPDRVTLLPRHPNAQTTRVVRLYRSAGSSIEQLNRVDWESPIETPLQAMNHEKWPAKHTVRSIVIHDLCKGAVTTNLVLALLERYPEANWYVRTKSQNPDWLPKITSKIAIFLVGPEVAEPGNPWGSWLSGTKISYQSFSYLRKIDSRATIVLSDQREVIGRINEGQQCLTAKAPFPHESSLQVGWPSAFLAALVHLHHETGAALDPSNVEAALKWAQLHAGMPVDVAAPKDLRSDKAVVEIEPWERQEVEWNSAMDNMGIITTGEGTRTLEVWRGASDLPGYVACIEGKREAIIDIGKRLRAFTRSAEPPRSLSILLQADPGSGKTHLAKLLAQKFDLSLQSFDVTTMVHRDDLLDLFDAIATEQANDPDRRVLVFVDEINATLDAASVYGAFLAPLEQGVYVRRGRVFSLKPCVWIFAGTDSEVAKQPKSEKISDFHDRLTATVKLDFKSLSDAAKTDNARQDVRQKARLEQVYLGATMIQKQYRDVEKVGEALLRTFYDLPSEESPARKIRKQVEELRNVQRGVVTLQNLAPHSPPDLSLVRLIGKA